MNTSELGQLTDSQLIDKANEYLSQVEDAGGLDKAHVLIRGEFYLNAVARRQQAKENREERILRYFELLLTIIIVVMISKELADGARQAALLSTMNDNTRNQTELIGSLIAQQRSMLDTVGRTNQATQQQLDILTREQQRRLAEEARHPVVKLALGSIGWDKLQKDQVIPIRLEMPNGTESGYVRMSFVIENGGDLTLRQGSFLAIASPDSVSLEQAATRGFNLLHKNLYSTTLIDIQPHSKKAVEIDVLPGATKDFELRLRIEAARMKPFELALHFTVK